MVFIENPRSGTKKRGGSIWVTTFGTERFLNFLRALFTDQLCKEPGTTADWSRTREVASRRNFCPVMDRRG